MSEQYTVHDEVAVIHFGDPPVNSLGYETRRDLLSALERAATDRSVAAIVIAGNDGKFSGGADIREFGTEKTAAFPSLHDLIAWFDESEKAIVAAIEGICLGGGLELALACHYRVASASALIGLPEVKLGLVPGGGGTQRLPRLAGVELALDMIVSGEPRQGAALASSGLLNLVVDDDPVSAATDFARREVRAKKPKPRARDLNVDPVHAAERCAAARAAALERTPMLGAPIACVDAIEASAKSWEEGIAIERSIFVELMQSAESKALRHAFFAERAAGKITDLPLSTPMREIASAAIVGGGTMGTGIAVTFLNAAIPTSLLEVDQEALDQAVAKIRETYKSGVSRGRLSQQQYERALASLSPTLLYKDIAQADIVIEAVYEDMAVKESVFAKLDVTMKTGAILATNTSTLDVNRIASATERPQDVVGMHFFSPAHVMRLLEVVRGSATAPDVLATVMQLAKRLKKVAVVSGVCDGFIGNRMLHQYMKQAGYLVEEGASPAEIDSAVEAFGMAMGPFRVGDLAGNDVGWLIRKRRYAEDADFRYPAIGDKLCELGRFGQKTRAGWYDYEPGDRTARPSQVVDRLIAAHRESLGITPREIGAAEIVDRLILALVNEGASILEEGIAARASDIDVVYLTGYGFPRWRGGPMYYADQLGLSDVVMRIGEFASLQHGDPMAWRISPLLARLAHSGGTFTGNGAS